MRAEEIRWKSSTFSSALRYNQIMEKKKEEPKVVWVQTTTGMAAQQALSDRAKQAKIAKRVPPEKVEAADD